jgi:hypothetical protein
MRRCLLATIAASAVLLAWHSVAQACLHDSEVPKSEREFKSAYLESSGAEPASLPEYQEAATKDRWLTFGATALGSVLLAGALAMSLTKSRTT